MKTEQVSILGMSCHHCVMAVKKELEKLEGVTAAEVAIGFATVTYDDTRVERPPLDSAIKLAGYSVEHKGP